MFELNPTDQESATSRPVAVDPRAYEYGTRSIAGGPVRSHEFAIVRLSRQYLEQRVKVNPAGADEVRDLLLKFSSLVGVWREKGDIRWRGEFRGSTDEELDHWLPRRKKHTDGED